MIAPGGTVEFRRRIEDDIDVSVSSPQAAEFFQDLAMVLNDETTALQQVCDDSTDSQLTAEVDDYVETLTAQTNEMGTALETVGYQLFETLLILLDYNNSW